MSALIDLRYEDKPVRYVMRDGEPWWVAKDVCEVLEHSNSRMALERLDDDEKGVSTVDTLGGAQEMSVINEPGLYALILGSRKPEAKAFKRWIIHDVLPSIRKHGMYATDELLDNPDLLIEVATRLRDERNARLAAETKVIELTPKAEFYDHVVDATNCHDMIDVAKKLGTGQNRLFEFLRSLGILRKNNEPYQRHIDDGHFEVVPTKFEVYGDKRTGSKTVVTGKGLIYLERLVRERGGVPAMPARKAKRRRKTQAPR